MTRPIVGAVRFLAEIKTTANLHHPRILPLVDSGEADGLLGWLLERHGHMTQAEVREQLTPMGA